MPAGDAGAQAPPAGAPRRREARVRLPAVRHALCREARAATAEELVTMGADAHHAGDRRAASCAILTVSDTRTAATDTSGSRIRALLEAAGHQVTAYSILPDEPSLVRERLVELVADGVEAVIVNGGAGLAPPDAPHDARGGRPRQHPRPCGAR